MLGVQANAGDDEVNSSGRPNRIAFEMQIPLTQEVYPHTGGIDHHFRPHLQIYTAHPIQKGYAPDPVVGLEDIHRFGVVGNHRSLRVGSPGDQHRQPRVIHLGVVESSRPQQPAPSEQRFPSGSLLGTLPLVWLHVLEQRQRIVEGQAEPKLPRSRLLAAVERVEKWERADQSRSSSAHQSPLVTALKDQAELVVFQVAQPTVDQA